MALEINAGSGNGLLPANTQPLIGPVLTHNQGYTHSKSKKVSFKTHDVNYQMVS